MLAHRGAYPADWKAISRRVRDEAGDRCVRCGHPSDRPGRIVACDEACRHEPDDRQRMLTVHHLDGDKGNVRWWNLLALCQVCHLQIQARVAPERPWLFDHTPWFRPFVAGFYASYYGGVEITRDEAERELDRWLALGQPWRAEVSDAA
jgi:hypothetical protein